jgi:hypothetical protein
VFERHLHVLEIDPDAGVVFDAAVLIGPATSFQTADSNNRRLEKDESAGSIPHVFSESFVWQLSAGSGRQALDGSCNTVLEGCQLAGIIRLQSGRSISKI